MHVAIRHQTLAAESFRAAQVKSLFNATDDHATRFTLDAELDIDDPDWHIGVVVGPSGTGKSSIGRALWDGTAFYKGDDWPVDAPIIDAIAPEADFTVATAALSAAGLGDVPVWLRPYQVLSTGQRFRADLARILAEQPDAWWSTSSPAWSTGRSRVSARVRSRRRGGAALARRANASPRRSLRQPYLR